MSDYAFISRVGEYTCINIPFNWIEGMTYDVLTRPDGAVQVNPHAWDDDYTILPPGWKHYGTCTAEVPELDLEGRTPYRCNHAELKIKTDAIPTGLYEFTEDNNGCLTLKKCKDQKKDWANFVNGNAEAE